MPTSTLLNHDAVRAKTFPQQASRKDKNYFRNELRTWVLCSISGGLLGLSAPGFEQWYLAWFGLVPFLLIAVKSRDIPEAFVRGLFFGTFYNFVYQSWYLHFAPDVWSTGLRPFTVLANCVVWSLVSLQQGALFGAFAAIANFLPMKSGFLPERSKLGWKLPTFVVLPALWALIFNKLGNDQHSLSIPWSLLEYSQYKQLYLLQITGIVGGIGLGALIVLVNVALCSFVARRAGSHKLAFASVTEQCLQVLVVAALVGIACLYGYARFSNEAIDYSKREKRDQIPVSALQGNLMFGINEGSAKKHLARYLGLAQQAPAGICVWPEWSIIMPASQYKVAYLWLAQAAHNLRQDWVVGGIDKDDVGRFYNIASAVERTGAINPAIYRKQYLVPFGERTPDWLSKSPFGHLCSTITPNQKGYNAGKESVVFDLHGKKVAPLICFELISPEVASGSVRKGGQILVDCSNTVWFDSKLLGYQSIAMSVMRAVENHRPFAFATSMGPSAIIDSYGRIRKQAPFKQPCMLSETVWLESDLTPFTRWFR